MYGVLYAISPELFPAKDRGTGNGLTATATRVFGIIVRSCHKCVPPDVSDMFHRHPSLLFTPIFKPLFRFTSPGD